MRINSVNQNIYNNQRKQNVSFEGKKWDPTNNFIYHGIRDGATTCCEKLIKRKPIQNFVQFVKKHAPNDAKLNMHLMVFGSTILSGFYVSKTLKNKDLDKEKRKTLAINQGLTYVASAIIAYTIEDWACKKIKNLNNKFLELNPTNDLKLKNSWINGFGVARTIIISSVVYRFIAPVIVTPIANALSNAAQAKNKQA